MKERVLAVLVIAACGGPGGDMGSPDGNVADTTAPKLVSTTPAGNAGVLGALTATFDEPLDPATVTASTVTLTTRLDESFPRVAGTVSVDGASVTFTPLHPLTYDGAYQLTIGAVADPSGNAFAGATLPFHAAVNALTREVSYGSGLVSNYTDYTLDGTGHQGKYIYYTSPGTNGTWFDGDDAATTHQESDYAAMGVLLAYRLYDPGADGKANTTDDAVSLHDDYTYDAELRLTAFAEHGATQKYRLDLRWTDKKLTASFLYDDAGSDGMWNTADDRGPQWREYTQGETGANVRITLRDTGTDKTPQTADDAIQQSTTYDVDAATFAPIKDIKYGGPGADMTWLNADDAVASYVAYTSDAHGLVTKRLSYSNKGADNTWFTPDDVATSMQVTTYNAQLLESVRDSYTGAGGDGVWGTPDDVRVNYQTTTYDAAGNRTQQKLFSGAGNDGMWHTADDVLSVERTFDTTH